MNKTSKNPLLAGLLNMIIPGSVHFLIKRKWSKFILTFIGMELLLAIAIWAGISMQSARSFSFPQGLCPSVFALLVLGPLFIAGQKSAAEHNKLQGDEVLYQTRTAKSQDTDDDQIRKIQKMRDEGLISEQQFENKKSKVSHNK